MAENPDIGRLFTEVYLERGKPLRDSEALRHRLGGYMQSRHYADRSNYYNFIRRETGVKIKILSAASGAVYYLDDLFVDLPLHKLLNVITLTWRFLREEHPTWASDARKQYVNVSKEAAEWWNFVARVLREENLGYTLDGACGVRFAVDEEYERSRSATLACFQRARYSAVLDAFEAAHRQADANPPDTKAAVRALFESIEILVRLMVETKNLNRWIVENRLKPMAIVKCGDDPAAVRAVTGIYDGLADWVDGLHIYRHGQPSEIPVAPSEEFAIYVLSSGAAFLRLLVELDPEPESTV